MEPEVLAHVPAGQVVDWSGEVFPKLLENGERLYGWVADGYWEDVGSFESYLKAQADVLTGKVDVTIDGFEVSPGVWVAEGAEVDPDAVLRGPLCIGDYAKVEAGAQLREFTVVGSNVIIKEGAFLHRAVVHNNVYLGRGVNLRGCVVGKNTDVMSQARIEEGAIVGDECVIEPDSYVSAGVKVYPFKTIEAGAVVNTSVIWESRGQRALFGPRGVSGLVNVEITPELCVRLASAYATTLKKGAVVTTARDASRAARALKRAVHGALNASAINVVDLEAQPMPLARFETARSDCSGGIALRTTPGDPQSLDIIFMDSEGADLSEAAQRKLERVFSRQEYRRAFPGEIAELSYPPRVVEAYTAELLRAVDMTGILDAGVRVVADCAGGTTSLVLPGLLGKIGVDVLTVNNRLDESSPTQSVAAARAELHRLAELVSSFGAAFGVRFDPVGERITLVDDKGALVSDDRALLVVLDLIAAERGKGRVALPVTTTRVAEEVCRYHGVEVIWTPTSLHGLYEAAAKPDVIFAADGKGGFVVPGFSRSIDGIAAFTQLLGLVARTRLTLSQIGARIPEASLRKRSMPTPWAAKGLVMRTVVESAGDREIDTTDGVRVIEPGRGWILVLPDPSEAVTHLWAEGADDDTVQELLDEWATVVERAGR
jgi:mannose-1-phosphate guanylyltransferase/phosphomannomutase